MRFKTYVMLLLIFSFIHGCSIKGTHTNTQQENANAIRNLFEPITDYRQSFTSNMDILEYQAVCFKINKKGANRINRTVSGNDLLKETNIVFFFIPNEKKPEKVFTFNPRNLELELIMEATTAPPPISQKKSVPVFRSVETDSLTNRKKIQVVRYDFEITEDLNLSYTASRIITKGPHCHIFPILFSDYDTLVCLRYKPGEDDYRIISTDKTGNAPSLLIPHTYQNIEYIRKIDSNKFIFSASQNRTKRLFIFNLKNQQITLNTDLLPKPDFKNILLYSGFNNGETLPVVIKKPKALNLRDICALVERHNPTVNYKRALYASSLIKQKIVKLKNYPSLNIGFSYTPAVGIFTGDPDISSGDYLAEGIARGLFGLVMPLFDFKKNVSLGEAEKISSNIAMSIIDNEINEKISEAIRTYYEIKFIEKQLKIDKEIINICQEKISFYSALYKKKASTRVPLLGAQNIQIGRKSSLSYHTNQLKFLKNRLKYLCGLSSDYPIRIDDTEFDFSETILPSIEEMKAICLLNHPRLNIAYQGMRRTFYMKMAGPDIRPDIYTQAQYGNSVRDFSNSVDDFLTMGLFASIPFSYKKAKKNHNSYFKQILKAGEIESKIMAGRRLLALEEALMDFRASIHDNTAKRMTVSYREEDFRIKKILYEIKPHDVNEMDPLSKSTAGYDLALAKEKLYKSEMDMGIRYANLYREMGQSYKTAEAILSYSSDMLRKKKASIWLWKSEDIIKSNEEIQQFIKRAKDLQANRIYIYLKNKSDLIDNFITRERFKILLNNCSTNKIEIYALLGEPEWIRDDKKDELVTSIKRIEEFNKSCLFPENRIRGIKLDLEPHTYKNWDTQHEFREKLNNSYINLLKAAWKRSNSSGLRLWVDCPVKYLKPEHASLLSEITQYSDGITFMAYFDSPEKVLNSVSDIHLRVPGKFEIGIEFSKDADPRETLSELPHEGLKKLKKDINQLFHFVHEFQGMAYHDDNALKRYFYFPVSP